MAHLSDLETYSARAAEARADADAATLENVRDRCLRAEAAWIAMAERAARNEIMRATLLAKKAADAAEAALLETSDTN
jgi:excinuclease UvrABC helicase subunit UvrB